MKRQHTEKAEQVREEEDKVATQKAAKEKAAICKEQAASVVKRRSSGDGDDGEGHGDGATVAHHIHRQHYQQAGRCGGRLPLPRFLG